VAYNILDQLGNQKTFFPQSPTAPPTSQQFALDNAMFAGQAQEEASEAERQARLEQARRADQAAKEAIAAAVPQTQFSQEAILRANGQLTGLKRGYQQAAQAGDMQTAQIYANQAKALRDYFTKQGMTGLFGADEYDANQADAVLQAQQGQAMQSFLDMASPKEVYIQKQREYLQKGFNEDEARTLAANDADEYQGKWERTALGAAYNYGVGNNFINQNGMRILSNLASYNPDAAAIGFKSYGLPVDLARQDLAQRSAYTAADIARNAAAQKHGFDLERLFSQGNINENLLYAQGKVERANNDNLTDNNIRLAQAQQENTQRAIEMLANQYIAAGATPEVAVAQAARDVLTSVNNNNSGGGSKKKGSSKNSDDDAKALEQRKKDLKSYIDLARKTKSTEELANDKDYQKALKSYNNILIHGDERGKNYEPFDGNWERDAPIIRELAANMAAENFSQEQIAWKVYEYALACGCDEKTAQAYGNATLKDNVKIDFGNLNKPQLEKPDYTASTVNYERQINEDGKKRSEAGKVTAQNNTPGWYSSGGYYSPYVQR